MSFYGDVFTFLHQRQRVFGAVSITLEPNGSLSANRIREIREKIKTASVALRRLSVGLNP